MKKLFAPAACAAAILLSSVSVDAILAPAAAQEDVSFDSFHDYLASYGDWVYSDRWGEVWIPENVPDDFQPYGTNGYWAATDDYGWVWVSNYEWGDVPFHYGRWVNDPDIGWLWIPGYVWSPAWVVWRHSGEYTGWMPMPPDPVFLGQSGPSAGFGINIGDGVSIGIDFNDTSNDYGYSQWYGPNYSESNFAANWVFVGTGHLADHDLNRYWAPRGNNVTIIHNTTNITNYTVVNNYIVNKGVDVSVVQRASGHPIQKVALTQVMKRPQFVAQANKGLQIQQHQRQINPRGTGKPNTAPAPSQKVVQGLSNKVPQHAGHAPTHVFTKTTITQAPAFKGKAASPAGSAMHGPGGATNAPGGAMKGPNAPEEKLNKKPAETAPETMHGRDMKAPSGVTPPGGAMNAPAEEHRKKPEIAPGGAMSTPPEEHHKKPETTPGGGMNGPMNMPMEHRATSPGGETPVVRKRETPAMAPAMHEAPKPSVEKAAPPPPKPEDKAKPEDKKKDEPHG